jgi:hypothetical protein
VGRSGTERHEDFAILYDQERLLMANKVTTLEEMVHTYEQERSDQFKTGRYRELLEYEHLYGGFWKANIESRDPQQRSLDAQKLAQELDQEQVNYEAVFEWSPYCTVMTRKYLEDRRISYSVYLFERPDAARVYYDKQIKVYNVVQTKFNQQHEKVDNKTSGEEQHGQGIRSIDSKMMRPEIDGNAVSIGYIYIYPKKQN